MANRLAWIDLLRGMAIFAVLVDHYNIFPGYVRQYSYCSVSLFFLAIGVTTYCGMVNSGDSSFGGRLVKTQKFVFFYAIATVVYMLYSGNIGWAALYKNLVTFAANPPFYFCAIYLQIGLISGILYRIISRSSPSFCLLWLVLSFVVADGLKSAVILPNLHGAGKHLFGSTFLAVAFCGMCLGKYYEALKRFRSWLLIFSITVLGLMIILASPLSGPYLNFSGNPPRPPALIYAFSIFITISMIDYKWNDPISKIFRFLGKYSVHIFMYHSLLLKALRPVGNRYLIFLGALLLPIILGYLLNGVQKRLMKGRRSC